MAIYLTVFAIVFPALMGALILPIKFQKKQMMQIYIMTVVLINSIATLAACFNRPSESLQLISITSNIEIALKVDGLGALFAGLVAILWPFATLYSFEYMKHEDRVKAFFTFYTMTYGITLGVAFSANAVTLYLFYELLTLITTPLVYHHQTKESRKAAMKYLFYSISGAALGFIALVYIIIYGTSTDFVYGGVIDYAKALNISDVMQVAYVLAFIGFGVKAAVFPFHGWLPTASVAPTTVTALLHAVAVVKAGAFAVIRFTYYIFGTEYLKGSTAQIIVTLIAAVTIIYGSSMAVKEQHFKRRLAYSTVSNLSYILIGVAMMTPLGLNGALAHMVFHAVMKITAFFCAGAVNVGAGRYYVHELDGLGRKMPVTFAAFTISSLAMVGVPPFMGFISKWHLSRAAVASGDWLAIVSIAAIFISAILVAIYMGGIVVRAYYPANKDIVFTEKDKDPGIAMLIPLIVFSVLMIVFGVRSADIVGFIGDIAHGLA